MGRYCPLCSNTRPSATSTQNRQQILRLPPHVHSPRRIETRRQLERRGLRIRRTGRQLDSQRKHPHQHRLTRFQRRRSTSFRISASRLKRIRQSLRNTRKFAASSFSRWGNRLATTIRTTRVTSLPTCLDFDWREWRECWNRQE